MTAPVILIGLALVAVAVLAVLARLFWARKLPIPRTARMGEVREARVTGSEATNLRINSRTQYRATWPDAAGQSGSTAVMDDQALPKVGEVLRVCVDPRIGRSPRCAGPEGPAPPQLCLSLESF